MKPVRIGPIVTVIALLLIAGCSRQSVDKSELDRLSRQAEETDARLRALQTRLRDQLPNNTRPTRSEDGGVQSIGENLWKEGPLKEDTDCPSYPFTTVGAERGTKCDDYEAAIRSIDDICVANCNKDALANKVIRAAMHECQEWCLSKNCHRASFIPPRNGCASYACIADKDQCPNKKCPTREQCSMTDGENVWNCLCRDVNPT
jgi:hypothetical protein